MWTMEQLVERVHTALAAEYPGAPNGRIREVPDRRSIRWYTTIGLVDRPLGTRGRVALYGPRHLLQLVAIKRRQAAGRTLAEIQVELTGASDEALAATARVPDELLSPGMPAADGPVRAAFWKHSPAPPPAPAELAVLPGNPSDDTGLMLTGVPLGMGVILLVPHALDHIDRGDLAAAARPLLDLLASRGLTDGRDE
ncbi:MerR family transcriptional regulator [Actinoplanes sp. NEAU-A11]|uniref:MerR family transcriptional regulator n=2 Tax=Actinoplanes aureus TaxID=2792083 RepID=A0A931G415_9ACTN|nr:MerR family transcriptional regulator [Actinoplanes aureus]